MHRTPLIASIALGTLFVTTIAWASIDATAGLEAEPAAVLATTDSSPSDDDSSPSDDDSPSEDSSPSDDDAPLTSPIVATHRAADAGSVTVEAEGLQVRFIKASANEGWTWDVEVDDDGREVEVTFRSGTSRVELDAEVDDGQLRFRVRDHRVDERSESSDDYEDDAYDDDYEDDAYDDYEDDAYDDYEDDADEVDDYEDDADELS